MHSERTKILFLRISYWVGAIYDAVWVAPMVFPALGASYFGVANFDPDPIFRYGLGAGAALMAGWTVLLLWADRRPVERRGVLLLTIIPVKVGLDLASLILPVYGVIPWEKWLLTKIDAVILYILFIFSYVHSAGLVKKRQEGPVTI